MKCLIADDAPSARELLRSILEGLVSEIVEAADGESALRLAMLHLPEIIILDIGMPRKSGFEVVTILRQHEAFVQTCIIALTAATTEILPHVLRQAGFSAFLSKPVRPAMLRSKIEELVNYSAATH